jgi:hypothetical protein
VAISRGGPTAFTNFPADSYDIEGLMATPLPSLVAQLRGQASRTRVEMQVRARVRVSRVRRCGYVPQDSLLSTMCARACVRCVRRLRSQQTSRHRGVCRHKQTGKWCVAVRCASGSMDTRLLAQQVPWVVSPHRALRSSTSSQLHPPALVLVPTAGLRASRTAAKRRVGWLHSAQHMHSTPSLHALCADARARRFSSVASR